MFISVKKNMFPTRRCIVVPDGKGVGSKKNEFDREIESVSVLIMTWL